MTRTETLDPDVRDRSLASLTESLDTEARLLRQLGDILRSQREGVAEDDIERVDDSVHATHRLLQTLGEARRRRTMLVQLLTDRVDVPISALDEALGERMTDGLRERQDAIGGLARSVSREVMMNRLVLEKALYNGEDYARRLFRPPSPGTYGDQGRIHEGAGDPVLINRRV